MRRGGAALAAVALLCGVPRVAAATPNLVSPRAGEVTTGGVKVRVLPSTEADVAACCTLEFQRWDGDRWIDALTMAPEGVADPVGVDFTRRTFQEAERWRVRARFTSREGWSEWREFTVPVGAAGPRPPAGGRSR